VKLTDICNSCGDSAQCCQEINAKLQVTCTGHVERDYITPPSATTVLDISTKWAPRYLFRSWRSPASAQYVLLPLTLRRDADLSSYGASLPRAVAPQHAVPSPLGAENAGTGAHDDIA
jgi:hypothetical protein